MTHKDHRTRFERGQAGFTLIEILVVIAVLGVLAGVVVFAVGGIDDDAEATACATELRILRTAVGAYHASTGYYPSSQASLVGVYLDAPSSRWDYIAPPDLRAGPPTYAPFAGC